MADVDSRPIPLNFKSGYQRDGTSLDGQSYLDGLWARFRLGRPRKMLGYQRSFDALSALPRKIHAYYSGERIIAHIGTTSGIQQVVLNARTGALISSSDRTPVGFAADPGIGWTLDSIYDTTSNVVQLIAHATPDCISLANDTVLQPYLGQIDSTTPLSSFVAPADLMGGIYTLPRLSGGIVSVQPYVFGFSSDGFVNWSAPNLPLYLGVAQGTSGAGQARVSAQKIVQGMPLRGGGAQSPAALFWSLSELITATFIGGTPVWAFNAISSSTSILSSDAVIEHAGIYFWAEQNSFSMFNGTVIELPNVQNKDWFFTNLNRQYAARSFAFKVPQFSEIWFCAPLYGATVPSHAAIYNLAENCWYDTELPNGGRACGYFAQGTRFPLMAGAVKGTNGYKLWQHETGYDQVEPGLDPVAVRSYFETGYLGGIQSQDPVNEGLSLGPAEWDFIQQGDMFGYLLTRANARAPESQGPTLPIRFVPQVPQEQMTGFKQTARLARLHVESNTPGGYYEAGRNLLHGRPAKDARMTS